MGRLIGKVVLSGTENSLREGTQIAIERGRGRTFLYQHDFEWHVHHCIGQ
jgi:hypothetical protein